METQGPACELVNLYASEISRKTLTITEAHCCPHKFNDVAFKSELLATAGEALTLNFNEALRNECTYFLWDCQKITEPSRGLLQRKYTTRQIPLGGAAPGKRRPTNAYRRRMTNSFW